MSGHPEGSGSWRGAAPAKVNLRLRVLAREDSGYHQLETVFQALELADEVELEPGGDDRVTIEVAGVPAGSLGPDEENLAVRAAKAFLEVLAGGAGGDPTGATGVAIRLRKRIPHGAGLGGGSSDAAAVLRGMNELRGCPLTAGDLVALAGTLGADVPFFLCGASRALAWGRGDRLLPLEPLPARPVVLAVPQAGMPTAEAYGLLARGRARTGPEGVPAALVHPGSFWEEVAEKAGNDFEKALFPHRPELASLRDALHDLGGRPALLAGSGSAVFGVFRDEEAAGSAARELESVSPEVRVIRTHTRSG